MGGSFSFTRAQRVGGVAIVAIVCLAGSACELLAGIESLSLEDASVGPDDAGRQDGPEAEGEAPETSMVEAASDSGGADATSEGSVDSGGVDGTRDAAGDAAVVDAGSEAAPPLYFGTDCPTGSVYTDPFDFDPIASGNWTLAAGTYLFDATNHTVTLVADGANTQMWIGPRPAWTNYTVSSAVTLNSTNGNGGLNLRIEDVPSPAPNDSGHMYLAGMWTTGVELGAETGGNGSAWKYLGGAGGTYDPMTSYVMQASMNGQTATISIDGVVSFTYTDNAFNLAYGSIGLHAYESTLTFGPVTVTCD